MRFGEERHHLSLPTVDMAVGSVLLLTVTLALLQCYSRADFLTQSKDEILKLRKGLTYQDKKSDILFLLDTSGSLSNTNFLEEKRFVTNLLNEIIVGFEATRVQVIPFGSNSYSYIDFISSPARSKNKCEFNEKFNVLRHQYGMTAMKLAFDEAWAVCFGSKSGDKRQPVSQFKTVVILLTDGYWNWPRGDSDPRARAKQLRDGGVEVLAIGVGGGISKGNLDSLVADPATQSFHLSGFDRFAELATYIRGGEPSCIVSFSVCLSHLHEAICEYHRNLHHCYLLITRPGARELIIENGNSQCNPMLCVAKQLSPTCVCHSNFLV